MADNIRGTHVSPGIYTKETDITYAVKSLGITTLGLVGETLKGPAFQPMMVENWRDFQNLFGGTSAEKFIGSQYPKYELPYIAKSYLSESNQLQVCRVLGLSGYNAGPAWVIKADNGMVIAVLRSRGHYEKYHKYNFDTNSPDACSCPNQQFDKLVFEVGQVEKSNCNKPDTYNMNVVALTQYTSLLTEGTICDSLSAVTEDAGFNVNALNYGKFKIIGVTKWKDGMERNQQTIVNITSTNYGVTLKDSVYSIKFDEDTPLFTDSTKKTVSGNTIDDIILHIKNNENFNDKYELSLKFHPKEERYHIIATHKNYGHYTPYYMNSATTTFAYSVTLNPSDNDYILKVLGTSPFDGTAPLYVESLYDVALQEGIKNGSIKSISPALSTYNVYNHSDYCVLEPVTNVVTLHQEELTKKYIGTRWLCDKSNSAITCCYLDYTNGNEYTNSGNTMEVGRIYTVKQFTTSAGTREYKYCAYAEETCSGITSELEYLKALDKIDNSIEWSGDTTNRSSMVLNNYDNLYYQNNYSEVSPILCDLNNYKDAYRYASTPWFVSNIKGDATHYELNKLFRFHTISDGNVSNNEVKVSIQNIKPDSKSFDVIIRHINDSDESVIVLEKYSNCTLIPGDKSYIAYKIGSFDGIYEAKSKYVTVEVNENLLTENSIPAGFLGYPQQTYDTTYASQVDKKVTDPFIKGVKSPTIIYSTHYKQDIKNRRQYFGLSNSVGVDIDMFTYKGQMAYYDDPRFLTEGFHLDSRLTARGSGTSITVDGESGYKFITVGINERTSQYQESPVIGTEVEMQGCIYENIDLRKFTAYFYGGFDGWDIYRESRTNTDDFKITKYQGQFNESNGEGYSFNRIIGADAMGINQPAITSDWYAYLAGIRQFANPEAVDINVFATPGIDIVNNTSLVEEVIEMIEEERADSIYVVTTPDKPFGAEDYLDEMYTPSDIVYELEDTNVDSNYTCTYYPWVKYHDKDNNKYIFLPPTKDVVRNMAMTDNKAHPWFAPAGISRGDVNCVRAKFVTKLIDEDVLYNGRINPIKTFASDGVKIWGQKNLQIRESQLNRIAVRRLLLRLRKLISISCIGLIFEPNDPSTKNKFLSTVTPIMDNIKNNRGISDYRIEINDSPESRDRRELPVRLFFKPYQALEYITLDFVVTPESVSFDDI